MKKLLTIFISFGFLFNQDAMSQNLPQLPPHEHPVQWVLCNSCKGNGICSTCNGTGYTRHQIGYQYRTLACAICNYGLEGAVKGRCWSCDGLGYRVQENGFGPASYRIIKNYGYPCYRSSSNTYTPTYTQPPSNSGKRRVERTCTSCNGTGLIADNSMHRCSYAAYPDGCKYGTCPRCSQSHCIRNTIHKRCYSCDGTGKRVTYE